MTPAYRVKRILDNTVGSDLNSWEKHTFLQNIKRWTELTDKQEKILREIEQRVLLEVNYGDQPR